MSGAAHLRGATLRDLLDIPQSQRFHEIIDGTLVQKAQPSGKHGGAQAQLVIELGSIYGPRSRDRGPGGWRFVTEAEVMFDERQVYRPDIAGWRLARLPVLPKEVPIAVRPDWVCEVLSPSNPENDLFKKMRTYQRCEVQHYWIVDPIAETLIVYRWTAEGYLLVLTSEGDEVVRAEPFDAVELSVRSLVAGDTP